MARKVGFAPKDAEAARELQRIPNIGPAMVQDLLRLGIRSQQDLAGRNARRMYEDLGRLDGALSDPCVWDVFEAAVAFARGEPARPWWEYSRIRKASAAEAIG